MINIIISVKAVCLMCALMLSQSAYSIGAETFFLGPRLSQVEISPDGLHQLMVKSDGVDFSLQLHNSVDRKVVEIFDSRELLDGETNGVVNIDWIDNQHIALILVEDRAAIADLVETKSHRYAFFIDIKNPPKSKDDIVSIKTSGWFAHTLPKQKDKFLYAKSGFTSRVYAIDVKGLHPLGKRLSKTDRIDGGQFNFQNIVAQVDGFSHRWFTTPDGDIVAALVSNGDGELNLMETADSGKTWSKLETLADSSTQKNKNRRKNNHKKKINKKDSEIEKKETWIPIAYAGEPGRYFAVLEKENVADSLYVYDYATDQKEMIYQHATADIFRVMVSHTDYKLLGVGVAERSEPQFIYFDDTYKNVLDKIRSDGYEGYLAISGSDLKNENHLIYNFSSHNPGILLLYNEPENKLIKLSNVIASISSALDSQTIVNQIKRDGLSVEYFLSKPRTNKAGGYPLVVIPHGGPIGVMDDRLYDPLTQYLVANGLAVLQVNYRGSAGYGNEFIEAGKKQWGSGMLEDIYEVLAVVKKRPDIAAGKVCIAGGSYGGYAALALSIKYPHEFICAASFAGVTDVQLLVSRLDINREMVDWYSEHIGNPHSDAAYLKEISPVYNAGKIKAALLLAHGDDDDRVDIEHLYRMTYALDLAEIPYEKIILKDVGHSFNKQQQAADFYSKLFEFLEKHLRNL